MRQGIEVPAFVIADNEQDSNVLTKNQFGRAAGFEISCPETALTGTVTVEVSLDHGVTFQTKVSGGEDVEIAAGKSVSVNYNGFDAIRLHSSVSETDGPKTFNVRAVEEF